MVLAIIPSTVAIVPPPAQDNQLTITAHGFTSADIGKPLAEKAEHVFEIWDDTIDPATTGRQPIGILASIIDANSVTLARVGDVMTISAGLLPSSGLPAPGQPTNNNRTLFWDRSAGKYTQTLPPDSAITREVFLFLTGTTVLVLIPANPTDGA